MTVALPVLLSGVAAPVTIILQECEQRDVALQEFWNLQRKPSGEFRSVSSQHIHHCKLSLTHSAQTVAHLTLLLSSRHACKSLSRCQSTRSKSVISFVDICGTSLLPKPLTIASSSPSEHWCPYTRSSSCSRWYRLLCCWACASEKRRISGAHSSS